MLIVPAKGQPDVLVFFAPRIGGATKHTLGFEENKVQVCIHGSSGKILRLIQTFVLSLVVKVPVAFLCLGIFHGPPPAASMSQKLMIAAVKTKTSFCAKARPLHML